MKANNNKKEWKKNLQICHQEKEIERKKGKNKPNK